MTGELPAVSDEVYKEGRLPLLELPSVAALAEDVGLDVLAAVVVRDRRDFVACKNYIQFCLRHLLQLCRLRNKQKMS